MGRERSDPDKPPLCSKGHGPKKRIKDSGRVQGWRWTCRDCRVLAQRRHYANFRDSEIERTRRWQRENDEKVKRNNRIQNERKKSRRQAVVVAEKRLRGNRCEECGSRENLHWHHRDSATKAASISRMQSEGYSLDALEVELAKCVLLCHACHAKVHR